MKLVDFVPLSLFILPLLSSRPLYDRHEYLSKYEDEPSDEFLEMYRPNSDGTTFIDDAYHLWQALRYAWRRGAGKIGQPLDMDKAELVGMYERLREFKAVAKPVPLAQVIKAEWEEWEKDPEFPDPNAIKAMGVEEFIATRGEVYEDDTSAEEEIYQQNHPTDQPIPIELSALKDVQ